MKSRGGVGPSVASLDTLSKVAKKKPASMQRSVSFEESKSRNVKYQYVCMYTRTFVVLCWVSLLYYVCT
jgi:hypothetical protein